MIKNFLHVSQCGVIRINTNTTPNTVAGICTDGLKTCLAFIIIGNNKERISMIHTAMEADEWAIVKECEEVGYPCKLYPIRGILYAQPNMEQFRRKQTTLMPRLEEAICQLPITMDYSFFHQPTYDARVSRTGDIVLDLKGCDIERIAQEELRHVINMINVYTKYTKYHALDLQYDNNKWMDLPFLHERAKQCVSIVTHHPSYPISNDSDIAAVIKLYGIMMQRASSADISREAMQRHVEHVQTLFLTSNDIVPRVNYPYYHSHHSVPKPLHHFKSILEEYRKTSSALIANLGIQNQGASKIDYGMGTPYHMIMGSLVTASFGIGECSESTIKLLESLVIAYGRVDVMFVSFDHVNRKNGMEQGHMFLVANIKELPSKIHKNMKFHEFINSLPRTAVIGDAFLGVSYQPNNIPDNVEAYFNAYGGQASLGMVFHMCNFSLNALGGYVAKSLQLIDQLEKKNNMPFEDAFLESDMKEVGDTMLIWRLKEQTNLNFKGIKNNRHYVFAKATILEKYEMEKALRLQSLLGRTHVTLFRTSKGSEKGVVIHKLNEPEVANAIQNYLQGFN